MPSVRVERVPVQTLGLGILGFDHLQLVYQTSEASGMSAQDSWFVIEGLREPSARGLRLGVEGWHGGTTLTEANGGAFASDLVDKIGTAQTRGSREIASGSDAAQTWATMVSHATDIEKQHFPYIVFALPSSPYPIINSSSLVGSLLFHAGVDIKDAQPFGMRFSPGTETLLGTSGDDVMQTAGGFTTLLGGGGSDELSGSNDVGRIDKLYGGAGDDRLYWSKGVNIMHGGQPELPYQSDGFDTVDYSGAGQITITADPGASQHWVPDFVVTFAGGEDRLFSIEQVVWDGDRDRILIGNGAKILESSLVITPGGEGRGDSVDFSAGRNALLINAGDSGATLVATEPTSNAASSLWMVGAERIIGSAAGDRIYGGASTRSLDGGGGDDLIDAEGAADGAPMSPHGFNIEIDGGDGDDTIVSGPGRTLARGGTGADVFVLGRFTAELVIEGATADDRLFVPWRFTSARFERDDADPHELLIRVDGQGPDERHQALVRIIDFDEGDLGLHPNGVEPSAAGAALSSVGSSVHLPRALEPRPALPPFDPSTAAHGNIADWGGGRDRPSDAGFMFRSDAGPDPMHDPKHAGWLADPHLPLVDFLEVEPLCTAHATALAYIGADPLPDYDAIAVDHTFAGATDVT